MRPGICGHVVHRMGVGEEAPAAGEDVEEQGWGLRPCLDLSISAHSPAELHRRAPRILHNHYEVRFPSRDREVIR